MARGHVFYYRRRDCSRAGADVEEFEVRIFGGESSKRWEKVRCTVFYCAPFVVGDCFVAGEVGVVVVG